MKKIKFRFLICFLVSVAFFSFLVAGIGLWKLWAETIRFSHTAINLSLTLNPAIDKYTQGQTVRSRLRGIPADYQNLDNDGAGSNYPYYVMEIWKDTDVGRIYPVVGVVSNKVYEDGSSASLADSQTLDNRLTDTATSEGAAAGLDWHVRWILNPRYEEPMWIENVSPGPGEGSTNKFSSAVSTKTFAFRLHNKFNRISLTNIGLSADDRLEFELRDVNTDTKRINEKPIVWGMDQWVFSDTQGIYYRKWWAGNDPGPSSGGLTNPVQAVDNLYWYRFKVKKKLPTPAPGDDDLNDIESAWGTIIDSSNDTIPWLGFPLTNNYGFPRLYSWPGFVDGTTDDSGWNTPGAGYNDSALVELEIQNFNGNVLTPNNTAQNPPGDTWYDSNNNATYDLSSIDPNGGGMVSYQFNKFEWREIVYRFSLIGSAGNKYKGNGATGNDYEANYDTQLNMWKFKFTDPTPDPANYRNFPPFGKYIATVDYRPDNGNKKVNIGSTPIQITNDITKFKVKTEGHINWAPARHFTLQKPPDLVYDSSVLPFQKLVDTSVYTQKILTQGQSVRWAVGVKNLGEAGVILETGPRSILRFYDGVNLYTANLLSVQPSISFSGTSDTIFGTDTGFSPGDSTLVLTFDSATIATAFQNRIQNPGGFEVRMTLHGKDSNEFDYPAFEIDLAANSQYPDQDDFDTPTMTNDNNGQKEGITLTGESTLVETPPNLSDSDNTLTQLTVLDRQIVTQGQQIALRFTVKNTGQAGVWINDFTNTKIEFADGASTYTATLLSSSDTKADPFDAADSSLTLVFDTIEVPPSIAPITYDVSVTLTGIDFNAKPYSTSFTLKNSNRITVQTPSSFTYNVSTLTKESPAPTELRVTQGQANVVFSGVFTNVGGASINLDNISDTFFFGDGADTYLASGLDVPGGAETQFLAGGNGTLRFNSANVPSALDGGTYPPEVQINGVDFNGSSYILFVGVSDTIEVETPVILVYDVNLSPVIVNQGQDLPFGTKVQFSLEVKNIGKSRVNLSTDAGTFTISDGVDTYLVNMVSVASIGSTNETASLLFQLLDVYDTIANDTYSPRLFFSGIDHNGAVYLQSGISVGDSVVVQDTAEIKVTKTNLMPLLVSTGQNAVNAIRYTFTNPNTEPGAKARLDTFILSFEDTAGALFNINGELTQVVIGDGISDTTIYPISSATSQLIKTVQLGIAPLNSSRSYTLTFNVASGASAGKIFRVSLISDTYIGAKDSTSLHPLTPTGSFSLQSSTVTIQNAAELNVTSSDLMPSKVSTNQKGVVSQRIFFNSTASDPGASVKLDSFVIAFQSETGAPFNVDAIVDTIRVTTGSDTFEVSLTPAGADTLITFFLGNGDSILIPAGSNISFDVTLDISSGGAGNTFRTRLVNPGDVFARDSNALTPISPSGSFSPSLSLASSLTTVENEAGMTLSFFDFMPDTVVQGQINVDAFRVVISDTATSPGASLRVTSFLLDFHDTTGNAVDVSGSIASIVIRSGGGDLETIIPSSSQVNVTFSGIPQDIPAASSSSFDIILNFDPSVKKASTIKVVASDSFTAVDVNSNLSVLAVDTQVGSNTTFVIAADSTVRDYKEASHSTPTDAYVQGDSVYALAFGLAPGVNYALEFLEASTFDTKQQGIFTAGASGQIEDTYGLAFNASVGIWRTRLRFASDSTLLSEDTYIINRPVTATAKKTNLASPTVVKGQTNFQTLELTLDNSANPPAGDLVFNGFVIQFVDSGGNFLNVNGILDRIKVRRGAIDIFDTPLSSGGTTTQVSFSGGTQTIAPSDPAVAYDILVNISAGAPAGLKFKIQIDTNSNIFLHDSINNDTVFAVPVSSPTDDFPHQSGEVTILNSPSLIITNNATMPDSVSLGQNNVFTQTFTFRNNASSPARAVQVSQMVLTFTDANGNGTGPQGQVKKIESRASSFTESFLNPDTTVTFTFGGPFTLQAGETKTFDMVVFIYDTATPGYSFQSELTQSSDISASDATSGDPVTAAGLGSPLRSGLTTIEYPATLRISSSSFMPAELSQGQQDVIVQEFVFEDTSLEPGANITLSSFDLSFQNQVNIAADISTIFSAVKIYVDGVFSETIAIPSSLTTKVTVDFGGSPLNIQNGDSKVIQIRLDVWETATVNVLRQTEITAATDVKDSDANSNLFITPTGAFALESSLGKIVNRAGAHIGSISQMPERVSQSETGVVALSINVANTAPFPAAAIRLNSFVLDYQDTLGNPITVNTLLSKLQVKVGNQVVHQTTIFGVDTQTTIDFNQSIAQIIAQGNTTTFNVIFDFRSTATPEATLKVQMTSFSTVDIQDSISLIPLTVSGSPPLSSETTLIQSKGSFTSVNAQQAPTAASVGQNGISFQIVTFTNNGPFDTGAPILVDTVNLSFRDNGGNLIDVNGMVAAVRILSDTGATLQSFSIASPTTSLGINFNNQPVLIMGGETFSFTVEVDISASAVAGVTLQTRIDAADTIIAQDSNSSQLVTPAGSFSQASGVVTIQSAADLITTGLSSMPSTVSKGQKSVVAIDYTLTDSTALPGATARVSSVKLTFRSDTNASVDINGQVDTITILEGVSVLQTLSINSSTTDTTVDFGGVPFDITGGDSRVLRVQFDIASGATAGFKFKVLIALSSDISSIDLNTGLTILSQGAFALQSAVTQIQNVAIGFVSDSGVLPDTVGRGDVDILADTINFAALASSPGANLKVKSFAISFRTDTTTADIGGQIDRIIIRRNGSVLQNTAITVSTTKFTVDFGGVPQLVNNTETGAIEIFFNVLGTASLGFTFKIQISDTSDIVIQDANSGDTIEPIFPNGLPLATETTVIGSASARVVTYFESGRSTAQTNFSHLQRVYGKATGLQNFTYKYEWWDPGGNIVRTGPVTGPGGTPFLDDFVPAGGNPADTGVWTIKIWDQDNSNYVATVTFTVQEIAQLKVSDINPSPDPLDVFQGQAEVLVDTVVFTNNQDSGARAQIDSMQIVFTDAVGNSAVDLTDTITQVIVKRNGVAIETLNIPADGKLSVITTFGGVPIVLSPTGTQSDTLEIFMTISSTAPGGADLTARVGVIGFTDMNEQSADSVTIVSLSDSTGRILRVQNSAVLTLSKTNLMPSFVSTRQQNVNAVDFYFKNSALSPANTLRVDSFIIAFTNSAGAEIAAASLAESITITDDSGSFTVNAPTDTFLIVEYTSSTFGALSRFIQRGDSNRVRITWNVADTVLTNSQSFRIQISSPSDVTAFDTLSGSQVSVNGAFIVKSSAAVVQNYARLTMTQEQLLFPGPVIDRSQGQTGVFLHRINFYDSVITSPGASLRIDSITLDFQDSTGNPISIGSIASHVKILDISGNIIEDTTVFALDTQVSFNFGGIPRIAAALDTFSMDVQIDIAGTATLFGSIRSSVADASLSRIDARDSNTGIAILSPPVPQIQGGFPLTSNSVRIVGVAALAVSWQNFHPVDAIAGQRDVRTQRIFFAAAAQAADVRLDSFTIDFRDTGASPGNPRGVSGVLSEVYIERISTGETFGIFITSNDTFEIFNFGGKPVLVSSGSTETFDVFLNISSLSPVDTFIKTALIDSLSISSFDSFSGNALAETGTFPLSDTNATKILNPATLEITQTSRMPASVSQGQKNIFSQDIRFREIAVNARSVLVDSFTLSFFDDAGSALNVNGLVDQVRINSGAETFTKTVSSEATSVTFTFGGTPRNISSNSSEIWTVQLDINTSGTVGQTLRTEISSVGDVGARDSTSLLPILPSNTLDFPVQSDSTLIQNPAKLRITNILQAPAFVSQRQNNVLFQEFTFENVTAAGANPPGPDASTRLDRFVLSFKGANPPDAALNISGIVDRVIIKDGPTTLQTIQIANSTTGSTTQVTVDFGGFGPRIIKEGESTTLSVYLDFEDTAVVGSFIQSVIIAQADIVAVDSNSESPISASNKPGQGFPLRSRTAPVTEVQSFAVLNVTSLSLMPDTTAQGASNIISQRLTFSDTPASPASDVEITAITIQFVDHDSATVDAARFLSSIDLVYSGASIIAGPIAIGAGPITEITLTMNPSPFVIVQGTPKDVDVKLNFNANAPIGETIATRIQVAASISARDGNSDTPITPNGSYPEPSPFTVIAAPFPSISFYKDAARTQITKQFSKGQTVYTTVGGLSPTNQNYFSRFIDVNGDTQQNTSIFASGGIGTFNDQIFLTTDTTSGNWDYRILGPVSSTPDSQVVIDSFSVFNSALIQLDSTDKSLPLTAIAGEVLSAQWNLRVTNNNIAPGASLQFDFFTLVFQDTDGTERGVNGLISNIKVKSGVTILFDTNITANDTFIVVSLGPSQTLTQGQAQTLTFDITIDGAATVGDSFRLGIPGDSHHVGGFDILSDEEIEPIGNFPILTSRVLISNASILGSITQSDRMPPTVGQGQAGVLSQIFTFKNTATPPSSRVQLNSFILTFLDENNVRLIGDSILSRIRIFDTSNFAAAALQTSPTLSDSQLLIDFGGSPRTISAGESIQIYVVIDILVSATVDSTIKTGMEAAVDVSAEDENSATALAVTATPGFALRSGFARVQGAASLNAGNTDRMPANVSKGQKNVISQVISLSNPGDSSAAAILQSLILQFRNSAGGVPTQAVESLVDTITIRDSVTNALLHQANVSAGDTDLSISFNQVTGNDTRIIDGDTLFLLVILNIRPNAQAGATLRTRINLAVDISAQDENLKGGITINGVFPLSSNFTIIRNPAGLQVNQTLLGEDTVSQGQKNVKLHRWNFADTSSNPGAALRLDSFVINFFDTSGNSIQLSGTISFLIVRRLSDGETMQIFSSFTGESVTVNNFASDSFLSISFASTESLEITADFGANASPGLRFLPEITASVDISSRDTNSLDPIGASGNFVLRGDTINVVSEATLLVKEINLTPDTVEQGTLGYPLQKFDFINNSVGPSSFTDLSSFTLHFSDTLGAALNVTSILTRVQVLRVSDSAVLHDTIIPGSGNISQLLIDFNQVSPPFSIANGETFSVEVRADVALLASPGLIFSTRLLASVDVTALDSLSNLALTPVLGVTPLTSDNKTITVAPGTVQVFKDSARAITLSVASTGQTVYGQGVSAAFSDVQDTFEWVNADGTLGRSQADTANNLGVSTDTFTVPLTAPTGIDTLFLTAVDSVTNTIDTVPFIIENIATLDVNESSTIPDSISQGQAGVRAAFINFAANAVAPGADVLLDSFSLRFTDSTSSPVDIFNMLSLVTVRIAGDTLIQTSGPFTLGSTELVIMVSRRIKNGETLSLSVDLDFWDTVSVGKTIRVGIRAADSVAARDENNDSPLVPSGSFEIASSTGTIVGKGAVDVSSVNFAPPFVTAGQQNIVTQIITLRATDTGAPVTVDSFILSFTADLNNAANTVTVISDTNSGDGTDTQIFSISGVANQITINYGTPFLLYPGETLGIKIILDFKQVVTISTLRTRIADSKDIGIKDQISNQAGLALGLFEVTSDTMTFLSSALLNVTHTDLAPSFVSVGQKNVPVISFNFSNGANAASGGALLETMTITFRNDRGETFNINGTLDSVTFINTTNGESTTISINTDTWQVSFAAFDTLAPGGGNEDIEIRLGVSASAASGDSFHISITSGTQIVAADTTNNNSLTVTGGFILMSGTITVQSRGGLSVTNVDLAPGQATQGDTQIDIMRFIFTHTGSVGQASVILDSFIVTFENDTPLVTRDINPLVLQVQMWEAGSLIQTLNVKANGKSETWVIDFAATPKTMTPGDVVTVNITWDFYDTALIGDSLHLSLLQNLDTTLNHAQTFARDANDSLSIATVLNNPSFGDSSPLRSKTTQVVGIPAFAVSRGDSAPDTVAQGQASVSMGKFIFEDTALLPGAAARLVSFTVKFADSSGVLLGNTLVNTLFSSLRVVGGAVDAIFNISAAGNSFLVDSSAVVNAGESLALDIQISIEPSATLGKDFRVQITSALDVTAKNNLNQKPIDINGSFSIFTETSVIAPPVGSIEDYLDVARTTTQDTFSLGQVVYIRAFGLIEGNPYKVLFVRPDGGESQTQIIFFSGGILDDSFALSLFDETGSWSVRITDNADTSLILAEDSLAVVERGILNVSFDTFPKRVDINPGENNVPQLIITFSNDAPLGAGAVKVNNFRINFLDADNATANDINVLVQDVQMINTADSMILDSIVNISNPTDSFVVTVNKTLLPGETYQLKLQYNFRNTAPNGDSVVAQLPGETFINAIEVNSNFGISIGGKNGDTYPLRSLVLQIFQPPPIPADVNFMDTVNLLAVVYHIGDSVYFQVTDGDQNLDGNTIDTLNVFVQNLDNGDSEYFLIYEVGASAGVFNSIDTGRGIRVVRNTAGIKQNGTIEAVIGDELQATYHDPNDPSDAGEDTIFIREQDTVGVAAFINGLGRDTIDYIIGDSVYLSVTDRDQNLDDDIIDSFTVILRNTTNPDTIRVTVFETGDSTGVFTDTSFGTLLILSDGTVDTSDSFLQVFDGDTIEVFYLDPDTMTGDSATDSAVVSIRSSTASITFLDDLGVDTDRYFIDMDSVFIRIFDTDQNRHAGLRETITLIVLRNSMNNDTVILTLLETKDSSGVFDWDTGTALLLNDSTVTDTDQVLHATRGDSLTFIYTDPRDANDVIQDSATALIFPTSGTVSLVNSAGFDTSVYFQSFDSVFIVVTDIDQNLSDARRDSITVIVREIQSGDSETILLWETDTNTGVFNNFSNELPLTILPASVGDGLLSIGNNDSIVVEYTDTFDANDVSFDTVLVRIGASNASIRLIFGDSSAADSYLIGVDSIYVVVTDIDQNLDATAIDTLFVVLTSLRTGDSFQILLREQGVNQGVFDSRDSAVKLIRFSGLGDTTDTRLEGTEPDSVVARYEDPDDATDIAYDTRPLFMNPSVSAGTIPEYVYMNDTMFITITEDDQDLNQSIPDTITVRITNTSTGETEDIILTETSDSSGSFSGTLSIVSTPADSVGQSGTMYVQNGDTLTVLYTDPTDVNYVAQDTLFLSFSTVIPQHTVSSGTFIPLPLIHIGDTIQPTITDLDQNLDVNIVDTISVVIKNQTTGETEQMILFEIGDSIGVFGRPGLDFIFTSFQFADSVTSSGTLYVRPGDTVTLKYVDPFPP